MSGQSWVCIGKIVGLFGVSGWVKVFSYTDPRENILKYNPWFLLRHGQYDEFTIAEGVKHGKGIIAKMATVDCREDAAKYSGIRVYINREQFKPLAKGEFYWFDLTGLDVITEAGQNLGVVDYLIQTGANDVLVVKGERERLIPFVQGEFVKNVDTSDGKIIVDWDPDF